MGDLRMAEKSATMQRHKVHSGHVQGTGTAFRVKAAGTTNPHPPVLQAGQTEERSMLCTGQCGVDAPGLLGHCTRRLKHRVSIQCSCPGRPGTRSSLAARSQSQHR